MTAPAWLLAAVCSLGACGAPFTNAADDPTVDAGGDVASGEASETGITGPSSLPESGTGDPDAEGSRFDTAHVDAGVETDGACIPGFECVSGSSCPPMWRPCMAAEGTCNSAAEPTCCVLCP